MDTQPSPITPEVWWRLLTALDAGAPVHAACRYAGLSLATWERERQRIPEFGVAADQVEMSGLVAAWRFLQLAAASEWRTSLEYVRLHNATRGRDATRVDEQDGDDPDADVTPDDVAAVIRLLHATPAANGQGDLMAEASGHPGGPAGANGAKEGTE